MFLSALLLIGLVSADSPALSAATVAGRLRTLPTFQQRVPSAVELDIFRDVTPGDWEYAMTSRLFSYRDSGYPPGYFSGKRILTRYEFGVALERLLRALDGQIRKLKGNRTDTPLPQEWPMGAVRGYNLDTLFRLLDEFEPELQALGGTPALTAPVLCFLLDERERGRAIKGTSRVQHPSGAVRVRGSGIRSEIIEGPAGGSGFSFEPAAGWFYQVEGTMRARTLRTEKQSR